MSTGRKLVSDVRSMQKLLSTDNLITDRVIFSELKSQALLLIKRETNLRRLWSTDTVFTTLPCLEMQSVPISECADYMDQHQISRSKHKLPRISEGNYQYVIQGVYSINAMSGKGKKLKEITINRYMNLLKLPVIKKEEYFWINSDYLYVTNPNIQLIRISALFEQEISNELRFPSCGCQREYSVQEVCQNPLDRQTFIPGYLEQQVLQMVSQKLLSTYFRIQEDQSQDGKDDNELIQSRYGRAT